MKSMRSTGFTLIEVMVVVAIVAVLALIAYPNYANYVYRAHRADGREMLVRVASAQERYYTTFNKYTATLSDLGFANGDSEKKYYNIASAIGAGGDTQSYTLTATPQGVQATDKCLNLTLTNTGVKSQSGNENNGHCW